MPATPAPKPATASLTRPEYESIEALSFSGLKELLKSPAHYRHWLTAEKEETKALLIGKATHSAVLTPAVFRDAYAQAPECDRRTKDGKAIWEAAQSALKPGQVALAFDDYAQVMNIADAVSKVWEPNEDVDGWAETPLTGKTEHGTAIKGIPDFISGDGWIWDLKTTEDVTERTALRTILSYKYHVQAAHYIRLAQCHRGDIQGHRIVMVEKQAPFSVAIYEVAGELLEAGRAECATAYAIYDRCRAEGNWETYLEHHGIIRLDTLPGSKSGRGATMTF